MKVLFYSETCDYCKKLILLMDKKNIIKNFTFISVDNNYNLPKEIKKVPTLIVDDVESPLEGKYAFEWVSNKEYFYLRTNNIIKNHKNKIPVIQKSKIKGEEGLDSEFAFVTDRIGKSRYQENKN